MRSRVLFTLGCSAALAACVDYRFEQKCPEGITESEIVVPGVEPVPADILFIVDNSGSMADEQQNLARNFEFFINQIAGVGDYQIAIISTDQSSTEGEQGGHVDVSFVDNEYRRLDSFDRTMCGSVSIELGCFRGPLAARRVIKSDQPRDQQISDFQTNVDVGSCGSGNEAGLEAMITALEKTNGGCNDGFLRPDANLVLVFVSDEEDFGRRDANDPVIPVSQYVTDLARFKDLDRVRVAAIVGSVDGDPSQCSINEGAACGALCNTPPPTGSGTSCQNSNDCGNGEVCVPQFRECRPPEWQYWTNVNCGWCSFYDVDGCCSALPGDRYIQFARAIEDRVVAIDPKYQPFDCKAPENTAAACLVDSICQDSFGDTLERIAKDLVIVNDYRLEPAPTNPEGVAVTVTGGRFGDGKTLTFGDDFNITLANDGSFATLSILGENAPAQEGESLDIAYVSDIERQTERRGACPLTDTSSTP